jgi:hypothetical protein
MVKLLKHSLGTTCLSRCSGNCLQILTPLVPGCMGMLCWKWIACGNTEISRCVTSKSYCYSNDVIAAEIWWTRRKLNTLKMVADWSLRGIMWKSTSGWQIGHPALKGLVVPKLILITIHNILHSIKSKPISWFDVLYWLLKWCVFWRM